MSAQSVLSSSPGRGAPTLPSKRPSLSQLQIPHTPPPLPPPLPPRIESPSLSSPFTSSPMQISPTASAQSPVSLCVAHIDAHPSRLSDSAMELTHLLLLLLRVCGDVPGGVGRRVHRVAACEAAPHARGRSQQLTPGTAHPPHSDVLLTSLSSPSSLLCGAATRAVRAVGRPVLAAGDHRARGDSLRARCHLEHQRVSLATRSLLPQSPPRFILGLTFEWPFSCCPACVCCGQLHAGVQPSVGSVQDAARGAGEGRAGAGSVLLLARLQL